MTIYIVTSGDYSDYGINQVFTSRENAQRWIDEHREVDTCSYGYQIEEWEADAESEHIARPFWNVGIWLDKGELHPNAQTGKMLAHPNARSKVDGPFAGGLERYFEGRVQAISFESEEHARKLAVEQWQRWRRLRTTYPEMGPGQLAKLIRDEGLDA